MDTPEVVKAKEEVVRVTVAFAVAKDKIRELHADLASLKAERKKLREALRIAILQAGAKRAQERLDKATKEVVPDGSKP